MTSKTNPPDRVEELPVTELDANGEAMMCEGCGTTRTIAAILARHGPQSIACCPERKMVAARYFWERANTRPESESVTVMQTALKQIETATLAHPVIDECTARAFLGLQTIARDALAMQAARPIDQQEAMRVREVVEEGDGFWRTCSGCYETSDGYNVNSHPHSEVYNCIVGGGCSECGGIGVIWDQTDYEAMARESLSSTPIAPVQDDER